MDILGLFDNAKKEIDEFIAKRDREMKFRRANAERTGHRELQDAISACRGKLEVSRADFLRCIRQQSRNIREGVREGFDTHVQEQSLKDAAIGYLLVREAIFALKSVNSTVSVDHANALLEEAINIMNGKQKPRNSLHLTTQQERDTYGYITTSAALRSKVEQVEDFFAELKLTGDIDECIENQKNKRKSDGYGQQKSTSDEIYNRLSGRSSSDDIDLDKVDMTALFDPDSSSNS